MNLSFINCYVFFNLNYDLEDDILWSHKLFPENIKLNVKSLEQNIC
jgi:hypothetical protein